MTKAKRRSLVRYFGLIGALAALTGILPGSARAQQASGSVPQFEASAGYSYIRANSANGNGGFNLNGGSASLSYNFTDRYAAVAEFGAGQFSGLPSGIDSTMYTYLFGPRVSFRKSSRVAPFAQALLGGGRLTASASGVNAGENSFAMALGGGVDVRLNSRVAVRLIQADYLLTRFASASGASATQNNLRVSAGIVFRFGSR
jgi:opacity protein-like surface antigen